MRPVVPLFFHQLVVPMAISRSFTSLVWILDEFGVFIVFGLSLADKKTFAHSLIVCKHYFNLFFGVFLNTTAIHFVGAMMAGVV